MSTEINTRGVIRSMFSAFPFGSDSECLSRQELLSGSSNLMNISGGDTECVPLDAIGFKAYPCKSQMDKAPLGDTILQFSIKNENHHDIWFSSIVQIASSIRVILLDILVPSNKDSISIGEEATIYPGLVLKNYGNKIDLYSFPNIAINGAGTLCILFEIEGTEYEIRIKTS